MSIALPVDNYDVPQFVAVAASFGTSRFGFVVTPNVDHLIRYCEDPGFRELYAQADYVLLDSRFLAHLIRLFSPVRLAVCPGSDLTSAVFGQVIGPRDRIVLVGATAAQADAVRARYGLTALQHIDPPMGFIRDPQAVERCLAQIEAASPFRFCMLAIGCPQQEIIASHLRQRGRARGLALCVGASINFLTGAERRAPGWMQRLGLEWFYRLTQDPDRLARRYLVRGPRIFMLLPRIRWQLRSRSSKA